MDDPLFTLIEVQAIHAAFTDAIANAAERAERMPSSAEAYRLRAQNILSVRNKILAMLPPEHRKNYPPFD